MEQSPSRTLDNLTSLPQTVLSGAKDPFVQLMAAAARDFFLFFGAIYKCTYLLVHGVIQMRIVD